MSWSEPDYDKIIEGLNIAVEMLTKSKNSQDREEKFENLGITSQACIELSTMIEQWIEENDPTTPHLKILKDEEIEEKLEFVD